MKKNIFFFLIFFVSVYSCKTQTGVYKYSTKSEKAIKAYQKAVILFEAYNYTEAVKELDNAIKYDINFIEAYMLKGDIYADSKKYHKAIEAYKKSIEIDEDFFANNYLNLAMIELRIGLYKDAKNDFTIFINKNNASVINIKRAEYMLKICEFGTNAVNNPVPFNPINLGDSINTNLNEYLPSITADEQTIVFTKRLPKDENTIDQSNKEEEDFYISLKKDTIWSKAKELGPPINTNGNEGAQCISPDGQYIYYTACNRPDGIGSCDIYCSKRLGNFWGLPINLGGTVNSDNWESQPTISSDGKTLYFTSNRSGGKGNMDIWKTTKNEKGVWANPENMGDSINTREGEMSPFIHPDNQTLYFSSNGHIGMGGFDIFYSRKDSNGIWTKPVNIGYPINTYADESYLIVNSDGNLAYYSSDMHGGKGGMDIYSFKLHEKAKPKVVTYIKGAVFNKLTKTKLEAKFELIDLKTGKTIIESKSDAINGEFLVCIPTEKDYALNVSKDGYLFYSENFKLTGVHSNTSPYFKDIQLQPIKIGETVILKNIFFDTDKFELKPESDIELEKLLYLLNSNPKIEIEISGHTDNTGDAKYNQILSENRAKAVYDYLINHNISKDRLSYKGYGKLIPIDINDTEEGRANNRRTEFKVINNN